MRLGTSSSRHKGRGCHKGRGWDFATWLPAGAARAEKTLAERPDPWRTSGGTLGWYVAAMLYALVGAGIALRAVEFMEDRSFSRDETFLALNIVERSFSALLSPLDFNQAAPFGFLETQKLAS